MFRPFDFFFWLRRFRFRRAGVRHATFPFHGGKIHYWRGGKGFPLLMIHGLGGRVLQDYSRLIPLLAPNHHILAPDLPGFGFSYGMEFEQSIAAQTDFIRDFLDQMNVDQVDLIGDSMGGWISLYFAHLHPHRVRRMVLIAPAGIQFKPPNLDVFLPNNEAQMRLLVQSLFHHPPPLPACVVRDWLRLSRSRRETTHSMLKSMLTRAHLMDSHVTQIQIPTLIIWGVNDRLLPVDMGRRLVSLMPHAKLHEIEDCGHLPIHEKVDLTLQKIEEWLGQSNDERS